MCRESRSPAVPGTGTQRLDVPLLRLLLDHPAAGLDEHAGHLDLAECAVVVAHAQARQLASAKAGVEAQRDGVGAGVSRVGFEPGGKPAHLVRGKRHRLGGACFGGFTPATGLCAITPSDAKRPNAPESHASTLRAVAGETGLPSLAAPASRCAAEAS